LTDTDGVGVWPNVSSWIRDESRSSRSPPKGTSLAENASFDGLIDEIHPSVFAVGDDKKKGKERKGKERKGKGREGKGREGTQSHKSLYFDYLWGGHP